ncbi:MAG: hypothetical protein NTY74_16395 [Ignavibacteriae bacterium]|nr:hypothetical protein [Ignavibacteriota bacterium]
MKKLITTNNKLKVNDTLAKKNKIPAKKQLNNINANDGRKGINMSKRNGNIKVVSETPKKKVSKNQKGQIHKLFLNESELSTLNLVLDGVFVNHSNEIDRLLDSPEDKERNKFISQHEKCMDYVEEINNKISRLISAEDNHLFNPELDLEMLSMKHYLKHSKKWKTIEIVQNGFVLDALWKGLMKLMDEFEESTGYNYHDIKDEDFGEFQSLESALLYDNIQFVDNMFHVLGKQNQELMMSITKKNAG